MVTRMAGAVVRLTAVRGAKSSPAPGPKAGGPRVDMRNAWIYFAHMTGMIPCADRTDVKAS
jgi:hypothetical protein